MIRGVLYLAGPYRAKNDRTVRQNIRKAEEIAVKWWKAGFAVICPHLNTAFFDGEAPDELWLEGDLEIVKRCDAVLAMSTAPQSAGATREVCLAVSLGKPIIFLDDEGNQKTPGRVEQ
jgi:nucleoside 2-deoxyribosyltransferase